MTPQSGHLEESSVMGLLTNRVQSHHEEIVEKHIWVRNSRDPLPRPEPLPKPHYWKECSLQQRGVANLQQPQSTPTSCPSIPPIFLWSALVTPSSAARGQGAPWYSAPASLPGFRPNGEGEEWIQRDKQRSPTQLIRKQSLHCGTAW